MLIRTTRSLLASLLAGTLLLLGGCQSAADAPEPAPPNAAPPEQAIQPIRLNGPITDPATEISGLTWHGDYLVLLPQYPRTSRTANEGYLFAIPRAELEAALANPDHAPITPRTIPITAEGLEKHTAVFQGCEAIVFQGDRAYLVVEATHPDEPNQMRGYVVAGRVAPDFSGIHLDPASAAPISLPVNLSNMSTESMLAVGDTLVTLYEANGANVNPQPQARLFNAALQSLGPRTFPTIEYRITDVTSADSTGNFWAINYFYPGERDKLDPAADSVAIQHGSGRSHQRLPQVERLLEFRYTPDGIVRTPTPPIHLQLNPDTEGRNWEGIVRLGTRGFFLATDKYPTTMLAFVPRPEITTSSSAEPKS